jgi:hypothetical protein
VAPRTALMTTEKRPGALVQQLRTPVGGVVVHDLAGAVAPDAASGAGRGGRDHPTAGRGCEGYQQAARHSAGAVDQRIVVAPASEPLHHLARGERRNGQGTRHGPVELGRLGRHVSARSEEPLCPRSLVAKRRAVDEDLVARSEPRLRGTDRTNHAGGLHAEGHRWQRAHIPGTGSDEVIPVPDARGSDLNEYVVGGRVWWRWKVEPLDWPTERSDARRSHRAIVAASRRPVASALAADVIPCRPSILARDGSAVSRAAHERGGTGRFRDGSRLTRQREGRCVGR